MRGMKFGSFSSKTSNFCAAEYRYWCYNNHLPGTELPESLLQVLLKGDKRDPEL